MSEDAIYTKLKEIMILEFQLNADSISPEKLLSEDLELDSLDSVDLLLSLGDYLNEKLDPSLFKNARTVQDMVDSLKSVWKQVEK